MMQLQENVGESFKSLVGLSIGTAVAVLCLLAGLGAALGLWFPKDEATALLQFPEPIKTVEKEKKNDSFNALPTLELATVEIAAYKRAAAMYSSVSQLKIFIEAINLPQSPVTTQLLADSSSASFWDGVASPVFPFSRRDQKEYGDIKSATGAQLLGLELTITAKSEEAAVEMVSVLSRFFTNALLRERIRSWTIDSKAEAIALEKVLQADIVRSELEIGLLERRAADMKAILARYPDAARMDTRQIVTINPNDGGERFLSPVAQLIGFESEISRRKEKIERWQRELKQRRLLAKFFLDAQPIVDGAIPVDKLVVDLKALAGKEFSAADQSLEWVREAMFRVDGTLDGFSVASSQFGVRDGLRVAKVGSRNPVRLALVLVIFGLAVLVGLALLRASLRTVTRSPPAA